MPTVGLTATAGDWQTGYETTEGPADLVLDGNVSTLWHTNWYGTSRANHWIQFELSEDYAVDGLRCKPREGSTNGTITEYEIPANPFTDVPDGTFYYDPVLWAVGNGITTGATATTFNPGGQCQRAQVVTFLYRTLA